jgi:hypothetical protein
MKSEQLWLGGLEGLKSKYKESLFRVDRSGIPQLFSYLEETDFFDAPASAKNHNNYRGGLVEHSLLVMMNLKNLAEGFDGLFNPQDESLILISLLHDVCKVNFYKETTRNIKVNGTWMQEPYYQIEDQFPYGHGEKSVLIIQRFLKLTNDEIMAIRWHMGGFDDAAGSYGGGLALRGAAEKYPLVVLLHMADLAACYLGDEKK